MMRLALGILIGLVCVFTGVGYSGALGNVLAAPANVWFSGSRLHWLIGFGAYFPVHFIFHRLIVLHIFGHELTHALWSMLFGGRIQELYVSRSRGGFATYTRGNFLVTLAPYFFPLYALVSLLLWAIAAQVFKPWLVGLSGFTVSFHVMLTLYSLRLGQSDIKRSGAFPALTFIYAMNCIVLGSIFCVATGASDVYSFWRDGASIAVALLPSPSALVGWIAGL